MTYAAAIVRANYIRLTEKNVVTADVMKDPDRRDQYCIVVVYKDRPPRTLR